MKKTITISIAAMVLIGMANSLPAEDLSIYDIQYTTNADGTSLHVDEVVDCLGGIVIHKYAGYSPKLTLYDPAHPDGWGGLAVKDFTGTGAFSGVNVGDWLSFTNTLVEESRGNTQLAYESGSGFTVESNNNPTPDAMLVDCVDIAAPVEGPAGEWHVLDHSSEKYEAMYLQVADVTVVGMGLGKADDIYALQDQTGQCWAADYMNSDTGGEDYHPLIGLGNQFQSVSGILEQYTNPDKGWDYYQLLTTCSSDIVPEPASIILLLSGGIAFLRKRTK